MATDATGAATSPDSIPTYATSADAPSGKGFNAAMAAIQTALSARASKPAGIVSGEAVVWNGTTWVRSSATNIGPTSLGSGTPDATKFLRGDGSWQVPSSAAGPGTELDFAQITTNATISATTEAGSTILVTGNSVTYDGTKVFIEGFCPSISAGLASQNIFINIWDGATEIGDVWFMGNGTSGNDPGMYFRVPYTPSAAAHTFKIGGFVSSGTAIFSAGLSTNGAHFTPAYIRVVKA